MLEFDSLIMYFNMMSHHIHYRHFAVLKGRNLKKTRSLTWGMFSTLMATIWPDSLFNLNYLVSLFDIFVWYLCSISIIWYLCSISIVWSLCLVSLFGIFVWSLCLVSLFGLFVQSRLLVYLFGLFVQSQLFGLFVWSLCLVSLFGIFVWYLCSITISWSLCLVSLVNLNYTKR